MTTATRQPGLFEFDDSYARAVPRLSVAWQAARFPAPRLLVLNDELAVELGADPSALREPSGIALLAGQEVPEGVTTVAQAYAGHQFGTFVPRLGDGRALLLGEVVDTAGRRRDVHLKGSGRTPFARGGDGLAAVGPMLREYVMGEAMHALGIPTTRGLAVLATGQTITRETPLPGALLVRVAASHLRVGTFQYASSIGTTTGDVDVLRALADHAIARHHPSAAADANPYLSLFGRVVDVQAELVARWMLVGFVHGVMNTDNTTISGETIDYGPCAFLDAFDPATRFSSIDHRGRYAYGNQPQIAQWNLARLGETLLPLIDGRGGVEGTDAAVEAATAELSRFAQVYDRAWQAGLAAKLGLAQPDRELVQEFLQLLKAERADFTNAFRLLADHLRGRPLRDHFLDRAAVDAWVARWEAALPDDRAAVADGMDRVNPLYIPRNHKVEEALAAATAGDLAPLHRLVEVLARPFERRPGLEAYAEPGEGAHVTYCGT